MATVFAIQVSDAASVNVPGFSDDTGETRRADPVSAPALTPAPDTVLFKFVKVAGAAV